MNTSKFGIVGIATLLLAYLFGVQHTFALSGSKAGKTFAAISYSYKTGAYGYATRKKSKRSAMGTAQRECRKHANDCTDRHTGWTDRKCISLATAPSGGYGMFSASTKSIARRKAIKNCLKHKGNKGCKTYFTVCQ